MIANRLVRDHGLKQVEAADILGVSQPAISLYSRRLRGRAIDLENESEVSAMVDEIARSLASRQITYKDFVIRFCDVCRTVRRKGLMCKLHKAFDSSIDIEKCKLCTVITSLC
jgi:hypothetical protein